MNDYQEVKITKNDKKSSCLTVQLRPGDQPNLQTLKLVLQLLKDLDRDYKTVEIDLKNLFTDQINMNGVEIQELLNYISRKFNQVLHFELNLEYWGNMFMIVPYLAEPIQQLNKNLVSFSFKANSRSMSPSISNKTIKDIGAFIKLIPQIKELQLEFSDPSPEKRKVVKDDGLLEFFEGFKGLKELKKMNLNLDNWVSFQRSKIKEASKQAKYYFQCLLEGKKLEELTLNLRCWFAFGYRPLKELCDQISKQTDLTSLNLNLFKWSYYDDSFKAEGFNSFISMFSTLKKLTELKLNMFDMNCQKLIQIDEIDPKDIPHIVQLMKVLRKQQNLNNLELKIYEYIPEIGATTIRTTLHSLKNLTKVHLQTNIPVDEQKRYIKNGLLVPLKRNKLIMLTKLLKARYQKTYRKEILYEILEFYENRKKEEKPITN